MTGAVGSTARRVVLVTGSGRGIGRAIVERLATDGWACAVNGRATDGPGRDLAAEIDDGLYVPSDVSSESDARNLVDEVHARWGRLDLLVNNAAFARRVPHRDFDAVDADLWQRVLSVNVLGPWNVSRAAAALLREAPDGNIVNISSLAGARAAGSSIPYAVSKAALNQLTVLLSSALAPDVRVNAVAPGFIDNDRGDDRTKVRAHVAQHAPLRRPGQTDEVAHACAYLADATYVTGDVITVDGGLHIL